MDSYQPLLKRLLGVISTLVAVGGKVLYGYGPLRYKQLQKPLRIEGIRKTRVYPDGQNGDLKTRLDDSKMIVNEITFRTQIGRRYRVRDLPSDGYFPDDSDGLVDGVSIMMRRTNRWKKVSFDEKFYQILTERYNEAVQRQIEFGEVLK